jgi:hypothetical protein
MRDGNTDAPLATAMSTAVEKDSTSTTISTSLTGASICTPASPHSQRSSYSAWSKDHGNTNYSFTSNDSASIIRSKSA